MRLDWVVAVLILVSVGRADEARKFKSLKEAHAAVLEARQEALDALDRERLLIPELFFRAESKRREAGAAWRNKEFDQAREEFEAAWSAYRGKAALVAAARSECDRLLGLREKKPPFAQVGFKQRKAVQAAHEWLARHQDPSGRWDCIGFMKHDPDGDQCDGAGRKEFDTGVTALALLAFLEAGFTDRGNHYALEVYRGLQWLRSQQDREGVFGSRESYQFIYSQAIATLVLAKAFAGTKDERFQPPLERGVAYLLKARQPGRGWRYDLEESDTSVTTWCFRALVEAQGAGLAVDPTGPGQGARAWLDSVTRADGCIGYDSYFQVARPEEKTRFPQDRSRAMTAAGTVLRMALDGDKFDRERILPSLDRCLERPPVWAADGSIDMYYWYYGSLAFAGDRTRARKWRTALHKAVLKHQRKKGAGVGSWDPEGVWGPEGGRVYSTAILTLALIHAG